jgi:virginiamycin B lyase
VDRWRTWKAPGNSPQVYAVYVDNKDIVWLSDFGANATLHFDPQTEQFTVLKSTSRNTRVRQILGRPGAVWLPESGADRLVVIRE